MDGAIPKRPWASAGSPICSPCPVPAVSLEIELKTGDSRSAAGKKVRELASENALVVFGRKGCCMSHVLKLLLQSLGVNPTVHEVGEDEEAAIREAMATVAAGSREGGTLPPPQLPAVFVGGRHFGGLERVMATHISGELVPVLKVAGALWL